MTTYFKAKFHYFSIVSNPLDKGCEKNYKSIFCQRKIIRVNFRKQIVLVNQNSLADSFSQIKNNEEKKNILKVLNNNEIHNQDLHKVIEKDNKENNKLTLNKFEKKLIKSLEKDYNIKDSISRQFYNKKYNNSLIESENKKYSEENDILPEKLTMNEFEAEFDANTPNFIGDKDHKHSASNKEYFKYKKKIHK
jgi:hypothetical protein